MDAKEKKIISVLKKNKEAMRPGDIAQVSGLGKEEVAPLLKKMKDSGLVKSPKKCFYEAV